MRILAHWGLDNGSGLERTGQAEVIERLTTQSAQGSASRCKEEFGSYSACDGSHWWFLRGEVTSSDLLVKMFTPPARHSFTKLQDRRGKSCNLGCHGPSGNLSRVEEGETG